MASEMSDLLIRIGFTCVLAFFLIMLATVGWFMLAGWSLETPSSPISVTVALVVLGAGFSMLCVGILIKLWNIRL
jgi:hypothetical protein